MVTLAAAVFLALLGRAAVMRQKYGAIDAPPLSPAEVRRLNLLQPQVRERVLLLRKRLNGAGFDFFLGDTWRDQATEDRMRALGRSAIRVSYHQSGRAADIYMRDARGRPDVNARNRAAYEAMHAAAKELGFNVLGFRDLHTARGTTFTDPFHVDLRDGLTSEQALARYQHGADRSADGRVYA